MHPPEPNPWHRKDNTGALKAGPDSISGCDLPRMWSTLRAGGPAKHARHARPNDLEHGGPPCGRAFECPPWVDVRTSRDSSAGAAGDVLFTTMGTVRAVVDYECGRIPAKGVGVHHLDTSRFDPAFVAASLSAKWNDVHQRGTSITHAVVNDLKIPVLPLQHQRRVAAEPSRLGASARQARALADARTCRSSGTRRRLLRRGAR